MTTIAANSTTTGTLPANLLLRVLGGAIVTISRSGAVIATQSTARDSFVGPYPDETTYSVVAGGAAIDIDLVGSERAVVGDTRIPIYGVKDANGNTGLAWAGIGGNDAVLQGGGARCSATLPSQAVPIGDSGEPSGNHVLDISAAAYDPYGLINTTTNEITIPSGHQRAEIFIDAQWFSAGGGAYRKMACEIYSAGPGWQEYQYVMAPPSTTDMLLPLIMPFKLLTSQHTKLRITANHDAATPQTIVILGTRFTFYKV